MCIMCQLEEIFDNLEELIKDEDKNDGDPQSLANLVAAKNFTAAAMSVLMQDYGTMCDMINLAHDSLNSIVAVENKECACQNENLPN